MQTRRLLARILVVTLGVCALPAAAWAQSAIAGVVKDTTGAVMPGVTVEAASPALIEKVRSVVTDGQGQYKIVDLRPGVYAVTFTLPGFNTVKRDGVELPTNFTATINGELRVGALEETVTVSGLSPVVDVQNAVQQTVLTRAGARRGADRPQHPDPRRLVAGRAAGAARCRRHLRHAEPRSDGAWIRRPRHHVPGRRHDAERHRGRRQRAELLQRGDVRGDQLPDQRDQRRGVGRRRPRQHDSQGRRQRLQGHACSSPAPTRACRATTATTPARKACAAPDSLNKVWDFNVVGRRADQARTNSGSSPRIATGASISTSPTAFSVRQQAAADDRRCATSRAAWCG